MVSEPQRARGDSRMGPHVPHSSPGCMSQLTRRLLLAQHCPACGAVLLYEPTDGHRMPGAPMLMATLCSTGAKRMTPIRGVVHQYVLWVPILLCLHRGTVRFRGVGA